MHAVSRRPSLSSAVFYRDPRAALEWLERAFGFARGIVVSDAQGRIAHAELSFGDGVVMIGAAGWSEFAFSPESLDGKNTQCVHVQLESDLDAHCERARAAGAVILQEPADQFYGDRTYRARDPERHVWTFARTVRRVSREEAERHGGLSIEGGGERARRGRRPARRFAVSPCRCFSTSSPLRPGTRPLPGRCRDNPPCQVRRAPIFAASRN